MGKQRIYQLFVRYFGNSNPTRKFNGTLEENGCGKFNDITAEALDAIRLMGFTHIYYTGVIEHATGTHYAHAAADDCKIIKGIAGSPFAVRDYFDVSADLAENTENRITEFRQLIERTKAAGLRSLIDFIPNHVARSYQSDIFPEKSFGEKDDTSVFFSKDNNFYYLEGNGSLALPGGIYAPEISIGKVSGNNAITWQPSENDWYETIKLNYGQDFRLGAMSQSVTDIPNTWEKMDLILEYWQSLGVEGFRCDMAHMVPMAFWKWSISRAKERHETSYFIGEAYNLDPMKTTEGEGDVLQELLDVGFDSVYDSEAYDLVKGIYEDGKWANDLDALLWDESRLHGMLKYVENHDEVRTASASNWGGWGAGVGKVSFAILSAMSRSPVMLYSGQEVGESAPNAEGFCDNNGRSTIFDYWGLKELSKWTNQGKFDGGGLDQYQLELRNWYSDWLNKMDHPVFKEGSVFGLNYLNRENERFGRIEGEFVSGHWLYAFLRTLGNESFMIVVNLHPTQVLKNVDVNYPSTDQATERTISIGDMLPFEVQCLPVNY